MAFWTAKSGLKYSYEIKPASLPVDLAFIHGNLASRRWWYPLCEYLPKPNASAHKGRIFLLEFLGCGQSDAPRGPSDVSMYEFAQEFLNLLDAEDFQGGIVGHSTGGLIAGIMLGEQAHRRLRTGFLLDPVGAKGVKFDKALEDAFQAMKQDRNLTAQVIGGTIRGLDTQHPYFQEVIVEDAFLAVKQVGDLVLKALGSFDATEVLKKIEVPVWVAHGEYDELLPKSDSQAMAALIPQGRYLEIPGGGHCFNYENPKELARWLNQWLKETIGLDWLPA